MPASIYGNQSGTVGLINAATAQNSTSGTSIDFTGIPTGVKRITVMFNGVSTTGTSLVQVQIGSGSFTTSGYSGYYAFVTGAAVSGASATTGFVIQSNSAANNLAGAIRITNVAGNTWIGEVCVGSPGAGTINIGGGVLALSGTLDRVRITTVGGTETFDAGSINILYE